MKIFSYILFFLFIMSSAGLAQSSEEEEEDPFKNDPFFMKPFHEFFQKPKQEDTTNDSEEVRYHVERLNDNGVDFDYIIEAGPYNSNPLYSFYPNLPMVHYNRVSGLFLGLEKERMQWYGNDWLLGLHGIQTQGLIGYSFAQKEWQYSIGLEKFLGARKYVMIGAEYFNANATDDYWRVGLTETTLTSFFAGYDFMDYYRQHGYGAYMILRSRRFFEGGVAFADNKFTSLHQETDWALFGSGDLYRANPPVEIIGNTVVDTVVISSLAIAGSFNPKRLALSRNFSLTLTGMLEIADPGISGSDYAYNRFMGELVTFINFEPGGVFKYRLRTGTITGEAPNFKEFRLGGIGSLRALPYKSLSGGTGTSHFGNQMLLSNAELQFGSPVGGSSDWIDFDDFYLSLFLDSGWVNYSSELAESDLWFGSLSDFSFSDLRHNGGIGLGSSLVRVELAWDLNDMDRAPVFWLRLNPTF